jgi:tRNA-2-methylthio-N6-dimethylallyladenosine synthase
MKKSYFIQTYGCQMNVADSELIEKILNDQGYNKSNEPQNADAIFINTCAIRDHAEQKVHSILGRFAKIKKDKPSILLGVVGCMAQSLKHDLLEKRPYVDIILGPDSYRRLPDLLERTKKNKKSLVDTKLSRFEVYDDLFPSRKEGINAWISIMRGCDKFCTFCIVPFTRGRERSRSMASILNEAEVAVKQGFKEITLLGQNVNSYNHQGIRFNQLIENVAKIPGIDRIRFTSPHPNDFPLDLLYTMAEYPNICNYVHLPMQSGSDRILNRMNRDYSKEEFVEISKRIRNILPNVGISTDIIVGFPGETDTDFQDTMETMKEIKFDSAYNFKYSPRRGTKASEYDDQVNDDVKNERLDQIISLQKKHTLERNLSLIGSTQKVLIEKESKLSKDQWAGRTDSNKWIMFDKGSLKIKDMVDVKVIDAKGITLAGRTLNIPNVA